jgi:hypothetical protein
VTLLERASAYAAAFPQYPDSWPWVAPTGRWLNAVWLLGNQYGGSGYYGSFPPGYMRRVRALFPDVHPTQWMHLYSGSLGPCEAGVRFDLAGTPTVRADARALPVRPGSLSLVSADPPYSQTDAARYGTPPTLNKPKVLRELAQAVRPGGHLVWLDTTLPMYRKADWHHYGMICIQRSTNHRVRLCSLFERKAA